MICEAHVARCPSSAIIDFAEAFFLGKDNVRLISAFTPQPRELMPSCQRQFDPTDVKQWRERLSLAWYQNTSFLLPNFAGLLAVRPLSVNSEITLEGTYDWQPMRPESPLDSIALAIASAATRSLLAQIVVYVEAAWIAFAQSCPSYTTCNARALPRIPARFMRAFE